MPWKRLHGMISHQPIGASMQATSPYLNRPLRSLSEALLDRLKADKQHAKALKELGQSVPAIKSFDVLV